MSLIVTHNPEIHHMAVDVVGPEDIQLFKDLVNRALNCWDRAPLHVKEFGDLVTEGKLMQEYHKLASEVSKK